MKSASLPLLALCALLPMAQAADPTPKPAQKHVVIQTITSSGVTIDTGAVTKNYKIDKYTVFTYQGRTVTQNDLKPGMRVVVTPGFDGLTATLVAANEAPKLPPASASPAAK